MPERQPLISNRGLIVAEGVSAVSSLSAGVIGVATESILLGYVGSGLMILTIGIELGRQKIKREQLKRRRRNR